MISSIDLLFFKAICLEGLYLRLDSLLKVRRMGISVHEGLDSSARNVRSARVQPRIDRIQRIELGLAVSGAATVLVR